MSYNYRGTSGGGYFSQIPKGTKALISINILIFLLQQINFRFIYPIDILALNSEIVFNYYFYFQLFTYQFLHGSWLHLIFNMLALFFIGFEMERYWGTSRFILFYLISGFGAGLFIYLLDLFNFYIQGIMWGPGTVGASGAILGLFFAFGTFHPNREVYFMGIIPLKVKTLLFVMTFGSLLFMFAYPKLMSGISHAGHFGGILTAFIIFRLMKNDYSFRMGNQTIDEWILIFKRKIGIKPKNITYINKENFFFKLKRKLSRGFKKTNKNLLDENEMTDTEIEMKIDELLEKISSRGLKNLSIDEQLFLDRVSKMYRHKFPD